MRIESLRQPYTVEQLEELEKAYASQASKVRMGSLEITFKSQSELESTINHIKGALYAADKRPFRNIKVKFSND